MQREHAEAVDEQHRPADDALLVQRLLLALLLRRRDRVDARGLGARLVLCTLGLERVQPHEQTHARGHLGGKVDPGRDVELPVLGDRVDVPRVHVEVEERRVVHDVVGVTQVRREDHQRDDHIVDDLEHGVERQVHHFNERRRLVPEHQAACDRREPAVDHEHEHHQAVDPRGGDQLAQLVRLKRLQRDLNGDQELVGIESATLFKGVVPLRELVTRSCPSAHDADGGGGGEGRPLRGLRPWTCIANRGAHQAALFQSVKAAQARGVPDDDADRKPMGNCQQHAEVDHGVKEAQQVFADEAQHRGRRALALDVEMELGVLGVEETREKVQEDRKHAEEHAAEPPLVARRRRATTA